MTLRDANVTPEDSRVFGIFRRYQRILKDYRRVKFRVTSRGFKIFRQNLHELFLRDALLTGKASGLTH